MKKILFFTISLLFFSCSKEEGTPSQTPLEYPVVLNVPYNVTNNSVDLSWTKYPDTDFRRYEVRISLDSSFTADTVIETINSKTKTSTTVTELISDTVYYFKIRLVKTDGKNTDSEIESAITSKETIISIGNHPYNITYQSADFSWSKYANTKGDFEKYEVHVSQASGFTPNSSTLGQSISNVNITSATISGLADNTQYYFIIRLVTKKGNVVKNFDSEERSALTWSLLFSRFEPFPGEFRDSLYLTRDSDDVPDPEDTSSWLVGDSYAFNSVNLINYQTVKVEYTLRANAWRLPAVVYWDVNQFSVTWTDSLLPVTTSSPRKFTRLIHDYQFLPPDQIDFGFSYEVGAERPSNWVRIYDVAISAERIQRKNKAVAVPGRNPVTETRTKPKNTAVK